MITDKRPSVSDYFFNIAAVVAQRATCPRLSVGAVLVRDKFIVSTGYNGSPSGQAHCIDVGCQMEGGHCIRTIHAEENALLQAAKSGRSVDGSVLYSTHMPCQRCQIRLMQAGVEDFFWEKEYENAN